jgi:hypothetical protein
MLDTWEQSMVDDVIAQVDGHPGDARAKSKQLFELAAARSQVVQLAAGRLLSESWTRP